MEDNKKLIIIKPKVYEDIDKIKDNLDKNITLIVNLEETDEEVGNEIAKHILNNLKTIAQVVQVAACVFCVAPLDAVIHDKTK